MAREIFVVARDRPDLYRYLSQTFADAENVQVIWDRRSGDRRESADRRQGADGKGSGNSEEGGGERRYVVSGGRTVERRRAERRTRASVDHELRTVGYAFLTIQ